MPYPLAVGLITLGSLLVLATIVWGLSQVLRDASIADIAWGLGFVFVAWTYFLYHPTLNPRKAAILVLVSAWGVRLALHILRRNWGQGEDYRYRAMRAKHGRRFGAVSLVTVFWLQAGLMWIVSFPLLAALQAEEPARLTALDIAGICCVAIGLVFEAVGDWQLARFKADPSNKGKVLDQGLWRYTRHPNYFGDAMVWWGLFLFAAATPNGWWTVLSPTVMTALLLKVSGVALLERSLTETKPAYRAYVESTSAFVPWPPRRPDSV